MFIRLLGEVSFGDDSTALTAPPGLIPSAVLAHLALARGRVLTPENLTEAVWDIGPDSSRNSIQVAITRLRRLLGVGIIEASRVGYRLRTDLLRIDWFEAEHHLDASKQGLHTGRYADALSSAQAAEDLYAGTPLAKLSSAAAETSRQAANELRAAVAICTVRALQGLDRMDESALVLRGEVAKDPLNEPLHALLIQSLAAVGRQADAVAIYGSLRRRLREELGISPSAATQDLFKLVLAGGSGQPVQVHPPHPIRTLILPRPGSSLIGREDEIHVVKKLFADGNHLVTLVGPGGIGKTRLAIEIARQLSMDHGRSAIFVDLTTADEDANVPHCVASVLECEAGALGSRLQNSPTLIVLDNAEHVIQGTAEIAQQLVAIEGIEVIVTSQTPLHLHAEFILDIDGLAVEGSTSPAMRLLADRAGIRRSDIEELRRDLDSLVRKVDGVPLALELLSSALRWQTAHQILAELPDTLNAIEDASAQDHVHRHSSISAAVQWSMANAGTAARLGLEALCVLRGSFSEAAATALIQASGTEVTPRIVLAHLIDLSLVKRLNQSGEVRFRILEPIRLISQRAGEPSAEMMAVHGHFYLNALARAHEQFDTASGSFEQFVRVEEQNLKQALSWSWALAPELTVGFLPPLLFGWYRNGRREEAMEWSDRAISSKLGTPLERSMIIIVRLLGLGETPDVDLESLQSMSLQVAPLAFLLDSEWYRRWILAEVTRIRRAGDLLQALELTEQFPLSTALGRITYHHERGSIFACLGQWQEARNSIYAVLEDELEHHSESQVCRLSSLGYLSLVQGKFDEADLHLGQALSLARHDTTPFSLIQVQSNLAWLSLQTARPGEALERIAGTFSDSLDVRNPVLLVEAFTIAGLALLGTGKTELAQTLARAAQYYSVKARGTADVFLSDALTRLTEAVNIQDTEPVEPRSLMDLVLLIRRAAEPYASVMRSR